jgi:hypothetical protein
MPNSTQQNRKDREMKRKRCQATGGKTERWRKVRQGKRGGDSDGARKRSEEMKEIKQRNRKRIFFEVISRMHTLNRQSLHNVNLLVS